jgi:hypothetical protein
MEYRELLTRRSSVTVIAGYGVTDYSSTTQGLINNRGLGTLASYSYRLNQRDHVGISYGFQSFRFPELGAGNIVANVVQLIYGREISTRMSFTLGAGPEFVSLSSPSNGSSKQIEGSANASFTYFLPEVKLTFNCGRLVTSGSGLYAGANTDSCQFSLTRNARRWSTNLNSGYVQLSPVGQTAIVGPALGYQYVFVGAAINRELGQHATAFVGYQFNDQSFGNSPCTFSNGCNPVGRHVFSMGIDLRTHPRRLE